MNSNIDKNELFPIFIKLNEIQSLIVGGGNVALEKLTAILANAPQAKIELVAPEIKKEILELIKDHSTCKVYHRKFDDTDLDEKDLIFLTTDDFELHTYIKSLTTKRHILTNTADTPDLCDFYLSSVVQKGQLKIAISTNGMSPTLAKRIKEMLNDVLPNDINTTLSNLTQIRQTLKGDFEYKVKALNKITSVMTTPRPALTQWGKIVVFILLVLLLFGIGYAIGLSAQN